MKFRLPQGQFFSFDLPNLPTFKAAARQHRTTTLIFFLIGYALVVFSLIAIISVNQELGIRAPVQAFQELPLSTAYGSQRHVFAQESGRVVAIYLNQGSQVVASTSEDGGASWQEKTQPLISEGVQNVSGAQDQSGNLHLVYEKDGRIFYRQVKTSTEPWVVSEAVSLDTSRLGHRPTVILERETQLPMVVWSSEQRRTPVRGTAILFMAARGDPTNLANWCNGQRTSCGANAFYILKGSADVLGSKPSSSVYHPVLAQMPRSGNLYLWWSNLFPNGRGFLEMAMGKKEGGIWKWGSPSQEDELNPEAAQSFTLSALADEANNQILVAYVNKNDEAKVRVYTDQEARVLSVSTEGETPQMSSLGKIGDQFSLTGSGGKYFLLYRNLEGRVAIRKYEDGFWSRELWESPEIGGYPSAVSTLPANRLTFIYVTPENKVRMANYDLTPPSPTPTPTLEVSPTATPSPTLEASPAATPSEEPAATPTEVPTPTVTPTSTPEATPTATPT